MLIKPKIRIVFHGCFLVLTLVNQVHAAKGKFDEAIFTHVLNDVRVVDSTTLTQKSKAKEQDLLKAPDLVSTGVKSRAELKFTDETVTRIGSNTKMSFSQDRRTINLKQGSVILHTPKGRGGGTIQTAGVTASILGTTIGVGTTSNGGFKLLVLEGKAKVKLPGGLAKTLRAGNMTFVIPGRKRLGPIIEFDLSRNIQGSQLLNGFSNDISSMNKIEEAAGQQQQDITDGKAETGDVEIGDAKSDASFELLVLNQSNQTGFEQGLFGNPLARNILISGTMIDESFLQDAEAVKNFIDAQIADNPDIDIDTSVIDVMGQHVIGNHITFETQGLDLSPFSEQTAIAFAASGDIIFNSFGTTEGYQGELVFGAVGEIHSTAVKFEHAGDVQFASVSTMSFDGTTFMAPEFNFDAVSDIAIKNSQFLGAGLVTNITARSIVLENVVFPVSSSGTFTTETGQYSSFAVLPGGLTLFNVSFDDGATIFTGSGGPGTISGAFISEALSD
ncbi:MAG: FecR family protein [Verrucomicrobiota bacterium]